MPDDTLKAELQAVYSLNELSNGQETHKTLLCFRALAEIELLEGERDAFERCYNLTNAGLESACERNDVLKQEVRRLEAKNTELNRRWQQADKAYRDAKDIIDKHWDKPWCSGNLGRALLAYHCSQLEARCRLLAEALDDLVAEQNGPPLLQRRHKQAWEAAMAKAEAALAEEQQCS